MTTSVIYSPRASLVAFGLRFQQQQLWQPVVERVHIKQKVRRHEPLAKVCDGLINILAGGHGLNESNTRVRPDVALQRAFGRTASAEQSSISRTFNACTAENVTQLRDAIEVDKPMRIITLSNPKYSTLISPVYPQAVWAKG